MSTGGASTTTTTDPSTLSRSYFSPSPSPPSTGPSSVAGSSRPNSMSVAMGGGGSGGAGGAGFRFDASSLAIPPFNPNNRRKSSTPTNATNTTSTTSQPLPSPPQSPTMNTAANGASSRRENGATGPSPGGTGNHSKMGTEDSQSSTAVVPSGHSHHAHDHRREQTSAGTDASRSGRSREQSGQQQQQAGAAGAKPRIYFGPYLLLQTLGEGEFGKVKLGVHHSTLAPAPTGGLSTRGGGDGSGTAGAGGGGLGGTGMVGLGGGEVAIKLIKRGNMDTTVRAEKVKREIDVLKVVKHPYIVRLFDVIETEKYMGIVLEYASGGELFDHILAHRYLKEKDASRLFSQLISGVSYLHKKKIVHRDLKLENLLLDRNRNIIITDFGFANKFEDRSDDLMNTSCGSPCYAAPELVVQDGRYVGSAVDVWSCGVILYAMLAGYLPFDDDPQNPDGDNINLLYKYIINTRLQFPDWIGQGAREVLVRMLVPDPRDRATMEEVERSDWLKRYWHLFERTVEEWEDAADREQDRRRQERRRSVQMQMQVQMGGKGGRGHAHGAGAGAGPATVGPGANNRHQSAMVMPTATTNEFGGATGQTTNTPGRHRRERDPSHATGAPAYTPAASPPSTQTPPVSSAAARRAAHSAIVVPVSASGRPYDSDMLDEDPFAAPPGAAMETAQDPRMTMTPATPTNTASQPHPMVIDSNADPDSGSGTEETPRTPTQASATQAASRKPSGRASKRGIEDSGSEGEKRHREKRGKERKGTAQTPPSSAGKKPRGQRYTVQVEYDGGREQEQEDTPMPDQGAIVAAAAASAVHTDNDRMQGVERQPSRNSATIPISVQAPSPPTERMIAPDTVPPSSSTSNVPTPTATPPAPSPKLTQKELSHKPSSSNIEHDTSVNGSVPGHASETSSRGKSPQSQTQIPFPNETGSVKNKSRHRKGLSTDKFFLARLLTGNGEKPNDLHQEVVEGQAAAAARARTPSSAGTDSPTAPEPTPAGALDEPVNSQKKGVRRKALSMVVEPFSKTPQGAKLRRGSKTQVDPQPKSLQPPVPSSPPGPSRSRSNTVVPTSDRDATDKSSNNTSTKSPKKRLSTVQQQQQENEKQPSPTAPHPSAFLQDSQSGAEFGDVSGSTKAKKVMDWFRWKSLSKGNVPGGVDHIHPPLSPEFDRTKASESPATNGVAPLPATTTQEEKAPAPESVPASRSASGAPSQLSAFGGSTAGAARPTDHTIIPIPKTVSIQSENVFVESKLRVHHGAIDQNAVTSRHPAEVMEEIKKALWNMGIEVGKDGEFKLKCVRRSKKKAARMGLGLSYLGGAVPLQAPGINFGTPTLDRRGLPAQQTTPSQLSTSPSSGFKSFFARKNSSSSVVQTQPSASTSSSVASPSLPTNQHDSIGDTSQPSPIYGDNASVDSGDEIRFSVELTRLKNFTGIYSVDIRRMKGQLWGFGWVYSQVLNRLELGDNKIAKSEEGRREGDDIEADAQPHEPQRA